MKKRGSKSVPDFSSAKGMPGKRPDGKQPVAGKTPAMKPQVKPKATSAKSGHRGG